MKRAEIVVGETYVLGTGNLDSRHFMDGPPVATVISEPVDAQTVCSRHRDLTGWLVPVKFADEVSEQAARMTRWSAKIDGVWYVKTTAVGETRAQNLARVAERLEQRQAYKKRAESWFLRANALQKRAQAAGVPVNIPTNDDYERAKVRCALTLDQLERILALVEES